MEKPLESKKKKMRQFGTGVENVEFLRKIVLGCPKLKLQFFKRKNCELYLSVEF